MNIWEADKLILFVAFVIPGFISIKIYELLIPSQDKDSSKQMLDAITYSCVNYGILFIPIAWIESSDVYQNHSIIYKLFYFFTLFIFPIIWVVFWKKIRSWEVFQNSAPHPTRKPWDYVFSKRKWHWVIITLTNGEKIGGKYANNSFSSSAPAKEQVYLEEAWVLNNDGGFERPRNNTEGIIIVSDEISTVELFEYDQNQGDSQ